MIRPFTCLSLVAAMSAGLYLYQEKHRAQLLDREIGRVVRQADQARDRIGLLRAEWALLNEPERLSGLAAQHLQLQTLAPGQYARLEDLRSRLPAVAPPPAAPPIDDASLPIAGPIAARAPGLASAAAATVAAIGAPASGPVVAPAAAPSPPAGLPAAPVRPVSIAAARPVPRPAAAKPREAEPAIAASPRPLFAPVMPAYQPTPVVAHPPTVQTASVTSLPQPAPFVGSSLGMARITLAAPVPIAPAPSALVAVASNGAPGYATGR